MQESRRAWVQAYLETQPGNNGQITDETVDRWTKDFTVACTVRMQHISFKYYVLLHIICMAYNI